ncbi:ZEB2-regulated ABC transporter 1, partial [Colletotrichum shisoi]
VRLCLWRGWKRLVADPEFTISSLVFNIVVGFILGSMFHNLKPESGTFYYRGGLIFFALLFNAFASEMEVLTLYSQRPVIEKHNRCALYHQSAEAISSYITELPYKITNIFTFNSILYFLASLNRQPGPFFFFFCLVSFTVLLAMSGIYRTTASLARTSHQAMVPVTLVTIGVMIGMVPSGAGYDDLPLTGRLCATVGAAPGSDMVNGDRYIEQSFGYYNANKWRNVGILWGYVVFFFMTYIITAEYARPPKSEGEVLVFRRGKLPPALSGKSGSDEEGQSRGVTVTEKIACGKPIFRWEDICYDVKIKDQDRRILDMVNGFVQPGVITALMGASGAGKTTLLDALANRVTMGVLSGGDTMDVHLETVTVREALEFSALQPLLRPSPETLREAKPAPQLLVFLDEPTSGLDSQTPWAICDLIETLAKSGQAVLHKEFASSVWTQFRRVFVRTAKHFWRSPVYIWSKLTLTILLALYIGFTFQSDNGLQGLQNQLYAFFMCLTTVNEFSKQIMPMFIPQRTVYEVRERPSRVYRWTTYFLSNVAIEMIWNTVAAVVFFFCWYYPARFARNTTADDASIRGFAVFLFIWMFFLWLSTFSQLAIAAVETADLASVPASLFRHPLHVLLRRRTSSRADLPAVWADFFMYRASPMTLP